MICPTCGYDNIPGVDECTKCLASLSQEDRPMPTTQAHHIIMTDPISALDPPPPICVSPEVSLVEAISELRKHNVGALLVTNAEGKLVGIFTERDVLYKVAGQVHDLPAIPISRMMTPKPTALKATMPVAHALHLMALHGFRHIPIVDNDGRPKGITSFRGMVQFIGTNIVPAGAQQR
ncbi:MAG: CBS domain-containing protein [Candidatus Latescibacteria bacterium]|nr:CBS domain-containing protein [Candidatus Latescibacterota bacterium]